MPRKIALGYLPAPACALAARAPHRQNGQALRSAAQPMAVGAVLKPRPAQGQRQAQVILGGVEPVQQPGVPGRPTSPPASRGRAGRYHPGRCRAAGGICARAARPARGRPDARFRRRDRRPAGTGNAAPRQAGRAYAPATPRAGQTKHHRRPPPGWRTVAREISSSMSRRLPDHRLVMVPRTRIQRFARSRVDTSKAMVRASSSSGPELHLAVSVDVIPDGAGPDQGPDVERERGFDQSAAAGSR